MNMKQSTTTLAETMTVMSHPPSPLGVHVALLLESLVKLALVLGPGQALVDVVVAPHDAVRHPHLCISFAAPAGVDFVSLLASSIVSMHCDGCLCNHRSMSNTTCLLQCSNAEIVSSRSSQRSPRVRRVTALLFIIHCA